jgi:hypothetical protein
LIETSGAGKIQTAITNYFGHVSHRIFMNDRWYPWSPLSLQMYMCSNVVNNTHQGTSNRLIINDGHSNTASKKFINNKNFNNSVFLIIGYMGTTICDYNVILFSTSDNNIKSISKSSDYIGIKYYIANDSDLCVRSELESNDDEVISIIIPISLLNYDVFYHRENS